MWTTDFYWAKFPGSSVTNGEALATTAPLEPTATTATPATMNVALDLGVPDLDAPETSAPETDIPAMTKSAPAPSSSKPSVSDGQQEKVGGK